MRLLASLCVVLVACAGPVSQPTPTPASEPLAVVELKYRIFDQVGRLSYCDPDFYPVARADELEVAREHEAEMRQDADAFDAILRHSGIAAGATLTDQQLLGVYRDWKLLRALALDPTGGSYRFSYRAARVAGSDEADLVEGTIDVHGRIAVTRRTDAGPLMCPICLADTTLVASPAGPLPVTSLRVGTRVWSVGSDGTRIAVPIRRVASVEAPAGHAVVRITLADGRVVSASPGHPTADGRTVGSLLVGDPLDGSTVADVVRLAYRGRTYDLLPAGPTGLYWADGVLMGSTIAGK